MVRIYHDKVASRLDVTYFPAPASSPPLRKGSPLLSGHSPSWLTIPSEETGPHLTEQCKGQTREAHSSISLEWGGLCISLQMFFLAFHIYDPDGPPHPTPHPGQQPLKGKDPGVFSAEGRRAFLSPGTLSHPKMHLEMRKKGCQRGAACPFHANGVETPL